VSAILSELAVNAHKQRVTDPSGRDDRGTESGEEAMMTQPCRLRPRTAATVVAAAALVAMSFLPGGSEATEAMSRETPTLNLDGAAIDDAVEGVLEATTTPGAVVLLRQGDSEYLTAYGTREYGDGAAVTVDDHFRIGSNTKTMTGTVILQLVDEGELALDDPVSDHLPDVPNGDNITITQLLDMRSGLHNYSELTSFNRVLDEDPQKVWRPEELAAIGLAEEPYFAPGDGFHYSNTNTVLLGMIIEEITGNSAGNEFRTRIFDPLGLEETLLPALDDPSIPEPHPRGYLWGTNESTAADPALPDDEQDAALAGESEPNDVTDGNPSWAWTAGAAISTARDLATYVEAMIGGGLLSTELQAVRLDSLQLVDSDDPQSAQYGLALAQLGPLLGHDGSLPGFQSVMGHDPETGLTMIVFTNLQAAPNGEQTANLIAQTLIPVLYADPGTSDTSGP
jgi:D-alanyl-D-alanine carboxypeptidase